MIAGRVSCDARRGQQHPARNCTGGEPKSLCHAQGQPKCLRGRDGLGQPSSVADGQLEWLGNAIGSPILAAKRRCLEQALAGSFAWRVEAALGKGRNYFFGSERVACECMHHHDTPLHTTLWGSFSFIKYCSTCFSHIRAARYTDTHKNNQLKHSPSTRR